MDFNSRKMEVKGKLPNETVVIVLGILSFVACCCTSGFGGLVLSGIGWYLAIQAEKVYAASPDLYDLGSLETWKIVNIVSFGMSSVYVIYVLYLYSTGQFDGLYEEIMRAVEEAQAAQQ